MELGVKAISSLIEISNIVPNHTTKVINGVASIDRANENDLSFCSDAGHDAIERIMNSKAGVILCDSSLNGCVFPKIETNQSFIFTKTPRLAFIQILKHINGEETLKGISESAVISKTAELGSNCYIGNYTTIGDNCQIGDNTTIYDRVSILENTKIGKNCIIQSGVTIGADGFAFERHETSLKLERFPHIGGVLIGDNVEISTNCSIARGTLSTTTIGNGTKLDSMVHVAHNVKIGENCVLTAGTIIGGGTTLGDACWTGLNSTLKHKIKIGNKAIVGCGATVIGDVRDEDVVAGVPAKSIKHKVTSNHLFLMAGQKASSKTNSQALEGLNYLRLAR